MSQQSHETTSPSLRVVSEDEWAGSSKDPFLNNEAHHGILLELMGADVDSRILHQADVQSAQTRDLGDAPIAASETHPVK